MTFHAPKTAVAIVSMACTLTFVSCGSSGSSTAPEPSPVPSVTGLSLTHPTATIFIGSTEQFEARETLTDGTTRTAATATWASDNLGVATVSSTGLLTALTAGEAIISATANGLRGTASIRVFPSFAGVWIGRERVADCRESGDFVGACAELDVVGLVGGHLSTFTQDGAAVTARIDAGDDTSVRTTGTITVDGELRLVAAPILPADPDVAIQFENWRSRADVPSRMTGSYDGVITVNGLAGSVRLGIQLQDVSRAAASTASSRPRSALLAPAVRQRLAKLHRK